MILKRFLRMGLAALGLSILLAFMFRGYLLYEVILVIAGILGLVMLALSSAYGLLIYLFTRKWPYDCWQASWVGASLFLFFAVAQVFAVFFSDRNFHAVEKYPSLVQTLLVGYHDQHGRYPENLRELAGLPEPPQGLFYWGNESEYGFRYHDPRDGFFSPSRQYLGSEDHWSREP